jgi:predicted HTH transcriptional regulator
MIYSLVHRLRKALNPHGEWFEFTQSGNYQLSSQVSLQFFEQVLAPPQAPELLLSQSLAEQRSDLNLRHHWILHQVRSLGSITPGDVIKKHQVTHMTAYRDLRRLVELRLLEARGLGRGTYYIERLEQS